MMTCIKATTRKASLLVDFASDYERPDRLYSQGSNPNFMQVIARYLNEQVGELESLYVFAFLWNNQCYHELMNELGKRTRVVVLTIPTIGYKTGNPSSSKLYDFLTNMETESPNTKEKAATRIYGCKKDYELRVVPHMSFLKPTSLEGVSKTSDPSRFFSMHGKFFAGFRKDGTAFVVIPSCNTDVLSEVQTNTMFAVSDLEGTEVDRLREAMSGFVDNLSVKNEDFTRVEDWEDKADEFSRLVVPNFKPGSINFTSPILKDSHNDLYRILALTSAASKEFLVASAQHLMNYEWQWRDGGSKKWFSDKAVNGVKVLLFSQTYLKGFNFLENHGKYFNDEAFAWSNSGRIRAVANEQQLVELIDEAIDSGAANSGNFAYCCNSDWHGRFLVNERTFVSYTHNLALGGLYQGKHYFENKNGELKRQKPEERTVKTVKSSLFGEIGFYFVLEDGAFCKQVHDVLIPKMLADRQTVCACGSIAAQNSIVR